MVLHGVGIDVVDVTRISWLLEAQGGRFATRWFTPEEVAACDSEPDRSRAFAERLAAKEAVWKALGVGGLSSPVPWRQIAVRSVDAPVVLTGGLADAAAGLGPIHLDWVSVDGVSVAVAFVETGSAG
nr:holo-ACP synthase [Propionicimonas sp.]